ncbi:Cytochrome P450 [Rhypophila decipiens]
MTLQNNFYHNHRFLYATMLSDFLTPEFCQRAAVPFILAVLVYVPLLASLHFTQHDNEPPLALHSVPFLRPLLAILTRRFRLFLHLRDRNRLPIYTVRLPWSRCYVINDTSLIPVIDRQVHTISFGPIEAKATAGVLGTTDATNKIMGFDAAGELGHFTTFHRAVRKPLSPGPDLEAMMARAVGFMESSLAKMQNHTTTTDFFRWIRHEITLASTDGEYGVGNPFQDPVFEKAWFQFLPGVPLLATGLFPNILAGETLQARELLVRAFDKYFSQNHELNGSAALLARQSHGIATGLPACDRARGELGYCMALVNNTAPSTFWLLYHVFSDPALLSECRGELEKALAVSNWDGVTRTSDDTPVAHPDLARVVDSHCPVLSSALQEVLRYYGMGTVLVRQVVEDVHLHVESTGSTCLLKKDGYVVMPTSVQHFSKDVWGPDAELFNPKRFLQADGRSPRRYDPAGLRVFGGGATLCPGRHYAKAVTLELVTRMILRFDVRPVCGLPRESCDGAGWSTLRVDNPFGLGVAQVFLLPENDVEVEISPRRCLG